MYRRLAPLQLVYGLNERKHLGIGLQMQGRYAAASAYITATKRNPPDARALDHLEEMFLYTPEINDMLPTIDEDLAECRDLVAREGSRTSWQLLLDA